MEDFFEKASFADGLALVTLRYGGLVKEGAGWKDTLAQLGQGGKYEQIGSLLKDVGIGTGIGGAAGLASSMFEPKHRRRPLSRAMTGAMLGALGGGGYNLYKNTDVNPVSTAPVDQQIHNTQGELGTLARRGGALGSQLDAPSQASEGNFTEAGKSLIAPFQNRMEQTFTDGGVSPDTPWYEHPAAPAAGGLAIAAGNEARHAAGMRVPEYVKPQGSRRQSAWERVTTPGPDVKSTFGEGKRDALLKAYEDLTKGKAGKPMSERAAIKTLMQQGTDAVPNRQNYANSRAHQQELQQHRTAYQQPIAALEKEVAANKAALAKAQQIAQGGSPRALARVQQLQQRLATNATKLVQLRRAMPPVPAAPKPVVGKGTVTGSGLQQQMAATRPRMSRIGRLGQSGLLGTLGTIGLSALQNQLFGTGDEAMAWKEQQTRDRLHQLQAEKQQLMGN